MVLENRTGSSREKQANVGCFVQPADKKERRREGWTTLKIDYDEEEEVMITTKHSSTNPVSIMSLRA